MAKSHRRHPFDILTQKHQQEEFARRIDSTLKVLARSADRIAKKRGLSLVFRENIINKLSRLRYVPPDSQSPKSTHRTFHEILEAAGVLNMFLRDSILDELMKWILLKVVLRRERQVRTEYKSVQGYPIQFHRSLLTEFLRHSTEIERIAAQYESKRAITSYSEMLQRNIVREFETLIFYRRVQSWTELFNESEQGSELRDEDATLKLHIYCLLKTKLQTTRSRKLGISDAFLFQLTELVWARASATTLPNGETLRRSVERHPNKRA